MPFETYAAIIFVSAVFATFAGVLAWGHWYTRKERPSFPKA